MIYVLLLTTNELVTTLPKFFWINASKSCWVTSLFWLKNVFGAFIRISSTDSGWFGAEDANVFENAMLDTSVPVI